MKTTRLNMLLPRAKHASTGWPGLVAVMALATLYVWWTFGPDFVRGVAPFWQTGTEDVTQYVAGFNFYFAAPWRWPLLAFDSLNYPVGTRVTFVDAIPIYSLLLKLVLPAEAWPLNPLGYWIMLCYVLQAVGSWWIARELKIASWWFLLVLTATLLTMPALSARLGHISLMSQWQLLFALALYIRGHYSKALPILGWTLLLVLGFYIHIYLFVMTGGIYAAAVIQTCRHRGWWPAWKYAWVPCVVWALTLPIMLLPLPAGNFLQATGFGYYSMNVLSPFMGGKYIQLAAQGMPGQYEGVNYLGLGALAAFAYGCWQNAHRGERLFLRHWPLFVLMLGYALYALSNKIYLGSSLLLSLYYPSWTDYWTTQLRSTGRFFWPAGYCVVVFSLLMLYRRWNGKVFILAAAAFLIVQLSDVRPFHRDLVAYAARPLAETLHEELWDEFLGRDVERLYLYPKYSCADGGMMALPVMRYASRRNLKLNTGYISRYSPACDDFREEIAGSDKRVSAYIFVKQDYPTLEAVQAMFDSTPPMSCEEIDFAFTCRVQQKPSHDSTTTGLPPLHVDN